MKILKWDNLNKRLSIGVDENNKLWAGRFTLMFDEYLGIFRKTPTIREFTLFQILWDNGAFWSFDLEYEDITDDVKIGRGDKVSCYFQIKILGIGLRINYNKKVRVVLPKFELLMKLINKEITREEILSKVPKEKLAI